MDTAIKRAQFAFFDQRTANPRFREKHLDALFHLIQDQGDAILETLRLDGRSANALERYNLELEAALETIKSLSQSIPDVRLWWKKTESLADVKRAGDRTNGAGIVLIEANDIHPIISVVGPFAAAIASGNAAVIVQPNASLHALLASEFKLAFDQDAFHWVQPGTGNAGVDAVVKLGPKPNNWHAHYKFTPAYGANPVIIDQSLLNGAPLPVPLDNKSYRIPAAIDAAATEIAQVISKATFGSVKDTSSSYPSYLLVHENILPLFLRALDAKTDVKTTVQPTHLAAALVSANHSPGQFQYLPIFSVSSVDYAIDLVNDDLPTPTVAYIFANEAFSTYVANQLRVTDVLINGISSSVSVQGPYRHVHKMLFTVSKHIEVKHKMPSSKKLPSKELARWKSIAAKQIVQKDGFRVDFFFSGILLSFGTAATLLLGGSGYGVYRLARFAWKAYYGRSV